VSHDEMGKEDSVSVNSDLFESSERVAPETILPLQETTDLAFVLHAPEDETVIDVWKTRRVMGRTSVVRRGSVTVFQQVFHHCSDSFLYSMQNGR
jgi:hypothetical protein